MISKPKGCYDIYGIDAKKWKYVEKIIDSVMEKYNYTYIRTPIFESSELFHRGIGETTDIVSKETYDFKDRGERDITLRPEGTAGVVRSYIENKMYGDATQPIKVYYNGTMYRYERPQSGRDRELTQFGVEVLGCNDPMVDAEVVSLAVNVYKILGLKGIKVNINSLGDTESRLKYKEILVNYFRPYIDTLCDDCKKRFEKNPLRILDCKIDGDKDIVKNAPTTLDNLNEESVLFFDKFKEYLDLLEVEYVVNPKMVRGLDYYNHVVFEIEADIKDFGSNNVIGAGGRYNSMVEQLGGPKTDCVGFASGIGRVILALEKEGISLPVVDHVDLYLMYVSESEKNYAIYLANELRMNGFIVEIEYLGRSLKSQFKQADRINSKFVVVLNDEELNNNELKIKNNKTREENLISIDTLIYYLDEKLMEDDLEDHGHSHNYSCGDDCHCEGDCSSDCNCSH